MVTRVCQRFQWTRFISLLDESKMVFTFAKVFAFFCGHRVSCFWAIFKPLYLIICQRHKVSSRKYPGLELLLIYYFFSEFKTKMKEPGPWLRQPKSRSCHFMLLSPEACHLFINTVLVRSLQIGLVREILPILKKLYSLSFCLMHWIQINLFLISCGNYKCLQSGLSVYQSTLQGLE